jgi:hypothetical protein
MKEIREETTGRENLLHHAAAWGGALCALAAWRHNWALSLGGKDWTVRIWPGHLLIESVQVVTMSLIGLVLGGWWWWSAAWRRGVPGIAGSAGLLTLGMGAIFGWWPQSVTMAGIAAFLFWGMAGAVFLRRPRSIKFRQHFTARRDWNVIFFASFVLLNTASDFLMAGSAPPGWLAAAGFVAARFLTQLILACALWCLLLLGARWWPRGAGWLGWAAVAAVPLAVIADMRLRLMWTKDLFHLCAELESGGQLDLLKVREGAGIKVPLLQIVAHAAVILAVPLWFLVSGWISRRRGWRISGTGLLGAALTAWVALMGLNVSSALMTSSAWRNWEGRVTSLHLTPFAPSRGVAAFEVVARDPVPCGGFTPVRRPDIFLFIVETLRADALDDSRTPNFTRFRADCQPVAEALAATNSTHHSWFGILHGRMPWFFESAGKSGSPAPMPAMLREAGYALEVRSAGNFDYENMRSSSFGDGSAFRVMEHVPEGHPERPLPTPEREKLVFRRLREAVAASPPGGVFRLTTLDSAHYPYRWPADWTPPLADYEREPVFPVVPSPEEIERVRRRYWNSVAWNDFLFGEFIAWLKSEGRYDDAFIILTGDHGEEFKEHGSWFHCSALNPQQTRVPLLIKWPAGMPNTALCQDASHLDLLPTVLDALGAPESHWRDLPGRSLRRTATATSTATTCYPGQAGETMLWRREGWEAAFSWPSPWHLAPPDFIRLERLTRPDGTAVECPGPADYAAELQRRFPDAPARLFSRWEPAD